ncbi:MAG: hypothetical protein KC549_03595 [Myxococcales bacterium]|nr:hypothetical protein [Myxococcales bacterium]MCB9547553.1 hypothetical protein [Myxococcales bacterium]
MARSTRPRSKAAQETARRREARQAAEAHPSAEVPSGEAPRAEEPAYRGGLLTGMRSGFKAVAGQGKPKKNKALDVVLWIAVLAVAAFVFARRF